MKTNRYTCPDVVVTAGGTREKIDDVRYIGNFSSGQLGLALAKRYSQLGHRVVLLAPKDTVDRFGLPENIDHRLFTSAASLEAALHVIPMARLVLQAAAVSDYTPEQAAGKISSDQEELVIRLRRNPKILLGLREKFGEQTQIVGFKLLSGVAEQDLIEAAVSQIDRCATNACVANDLQDIGSSRRLHLVKPDRTYQTIEGDTLSVAHQITEALPVEEMSYARN